MIPLCLRKTNILLCDDCKQVIVRKWDQQNERLVKLSEEEVCIHLKYAYSLSLSLSLSRSPRFGSICKLI